MNTIVHKVLKLPSDFNEMESFIISNKSMLTEHVIDCIEYAVKNKLNSINIFNFNTRGGFYISLKYETFLENIKMIYQFYISEELYENCERIVDLQNKIKNHIYDKNDSKKRFEFKSTSRG